MTKSGIWRLMSRHHLPDPRRSHPSQRHHNPLCRRGQNAVVHCDEAEIIKSPLKDNQPVLEDETVSQHPNCTKKIDLAALVAEPLDLRPKEKQVSFSDVHVRTYEVIPGDNPDCSFPLSLGWRYSTQNALDVDSYESQRHTKREQGRVDGELPFSGVPLTLYERRLRLRSMGYSEQGLRRAERKRRVELCLQWSSGQCPKSEEFPYSNKYYLNYVL